MSGPGPDDPSGRFCREVERVFVARRGGASVVSPADWQLILDWERRGIPLPVVVEGIGRAFDRRASASGWLRLRACVPAVEAAFAGYRRSRAGLPETAAASEPAAPPPPDESRGEGTAKTPPTRTAPAARRPNGVPSAAAEEDALRARLFELAAGLRAWQPDASAVEPEPAAAAASLAAGRIADLAASLSSSSPSRGAALPPEDAVPDRPVRKSGERPSARSADRGGVRGGGAPLPAKDGGGNRVAIRAASPGEERPAAETDGDFLPSGRGAEGGALFPRAVDTRLEAVEEELLRSLAEALRPEASAAITAAAGEPLAAYRRRMPSSGYREALAAAVRRRLPRALALPPFRLDDRVDGRA